MSNHPVITRRALLALAAVPLLSGAHTKKLPVGLELYSVRGEMKKDLTSTLASVGKMGYQCVEFYSAYFEWTADYAKQVRKQLDDLGVKCYSTHNAPVAFSGDGLQKAIELNHILGSHYVIMASAGKTTTLDDWKRVADKLNQGNAGLKKNGLHAGYHNHQVEWIPLEGKKPLELLAASTDKSVALQFDVGTCLETGNDPIAWINANPGRIKSLHLKDWNKAKGYRVLFGEGDGPWQKIFTACEKTGGTEFYLIEQEGADFPEIETAEKCLANYRKLRA
jgi:sugar phosphate isomerase/epimerase